MTGHTPRPNPIPTYQVGVFALVQKQDTILLVRPHRLLLPGGPQSLPGLILQSSTPGLGIVETALRRTLLSQVGISVSDLRLVGSHLIRAGTEQQPIMRLNMIYGTEYNSGILNPQTDELKTALWIATSQLDGQVPEWLRAALQELQHAAPTATRESSSLGGLLTRRRQQS